MYNDRLGFVYGSDTSEAAADSMELTAREMRALIFEMIRDAVPYGLTCDEVEILRGWKHQTVSARITELKHIGRIYDTGQRRPTRSDRNAAVYMVAVRFDEDIEELL